MPVANRLGGTDRSTSLRSDERSTSPEFVFHIPECVFHFTEIRTQTLLDTSSQASIASVDRLENLQPPAPDPEAPDTQGNTHDRDPGYDR